MALGHFVRCALTGMTLIGLARARSMQDRVAVGECADGATYQPGTNVFALESQFGTLPSSMVVSAEPGVAVNQLKPVKYASSFKVLQGAMAKEQYVLTQCGTPQPTDDEVNAVAALPNGFIRKHFTIPLQTVTAPSTTLLSFLDALGLQDRVSHVSQWASGACWQKAVGCGAGNSTLLTARQDNADAAFMDCTSTTPVDCGNVRAQGNGVHFAATIEETPLRSAEHIKFLAAFFNKEEEADDFMAKAVEKYQAATVSSSTKPVVAWVSYSTWPEASFVLSQAAYKLRMVTDVGGANVDGAAVKSQIGNKMEEKLIMADDPAVGKTYTVKVASYNSAQEAADAFFGALTGVDAIVDETYAPDPSAHTFSEFLSQMGLTTTSTLKFIQNKMVIRYDGTLSESNGLDWFESRVAHPHWAVQGLARVLHKDSTKTMKYFRNLAEGETPEVIDKSTCTKTLPVCEATAEPAPIDMLVGGKTDASGARNCLPCLAVFLVLRWLVSL